MDLNRNTRLRSAVPAVLLLSLLTLSLAPQISLAAAPDPKMVQAIDTLMAENYPADEPGAAVLVEKDGQVLLRKGYGMANLELGVPVSPDMVFEVGSVTKQFTAAAIMMLVERGKLRLDDEITRHLPDFPTHGKTITIEHLLTHTSGIPSYTGIPEWQAHRRDDFSVEQLVAIFRGKPLEFEPGEKWAYNNSGYVLLGAIIEKLSGKTYEDFIEQEIFRPLGMEHSRYGSRSEVVQLRAAGYEKEENGYRNASYVSMTQPYAAGALMSTVDDLARWHRALLGETLLRRASIDRMFKPVSLRSGISTKYAYGWSNFDLEGHRAIEHGGDIQGFTAHILRVPEDRLLVTILSNNPYAARRPDAIASRIAARVLGLSMENRKAINLSPEAMAEYVAVYRLDPNTTRTVTLDGGRLYAQRLHGNRQAIVPIGRDLFAYENSDSRLFFTRDAAGKITGMRLSPRFGPDDVGVRTDEAPPAERQAVKVDPALYDAYVGEYALGPQMTINVLREGDRIFAHPTRQPKREIFPLSETEYFLKEADVRLVFVRGADGKVDSLVLHQGSKETPAKRVK